MKAITTTILTLCFLTAAMATEEAGNPSFRPGADGKPKGWTLGNAKPVEFEDGRTGVALPTGNPGSFAKVYRHESLEPAALESITVKALVRTKGGDGPGEAGRLRLFYCGEGGKFQKGSFLWPGGTSGFFAAIPAGTEWREVEFTLDTPLSANAFEAAIETSDPKRTIEVARLEVEKKPRDPESLKVPEGAVRNLLRGISTGFEGGLAGWQVFILPHYPAVYLPPEFETSNPAEGSSSIRLKPGAGLNSMPISEARGFKILTLSMMARATAETFAILRLGQGDGNFQDLRVPVGTEWKRVSASYVVPETWVSPFIFIENRGDALGGGPEIFLDSVCLNPGLGADFLKPDSELVLSRVDGGVSAVLHTNKPPAPGEWIWTLEDVLPESRTISEGTVEWTPAGESVYTTRFEVPRAQGLKRVVVGRAEEDWVLPDGELLIANRDFADMPAPVDGKAPVEVGIHAHHNLVPLPEAPWARNLHPDWTAFLKDVRAMGARWMRFHGGRPDFAKMGFAFPESVDGDPRTVHGELQAYRDAGFLLLGVVDLGYGHMSLPAAWFDARETHGEWMTNKVPKDIGLWETYVRKVSSAYRDTFDAWEILNEPNGSMQASDYMPLLQSAYPILKQIAPNKPVLGICSTADFGTELSGFVEECFEMGAGDSLDGLSYHPYVGTETPEQSLLHMQNMRQVLDKAGLSKKAVWVSEVGWPVAPAYVSHRLQGQAISGVPAELGAAYTARNILNSTREEVSHYFIWSGMNPVFAWSIGGTFNPLFEYDGTPSPLYFAVGTAIRALSEKKFSKALEFRGGGLLAYLYDQPGGGTMAAVWTNERLDPIPLRGDLGAKIPDSGWNSAGRPITESDRKNLIAGPFPIYLSWSSTPPAEVEGLLRSISWEASHRSAAAVRPLTDGRGFAIVAENKSENPIRVSWTPDGGERVVQTVRIGETVEIARVETPSPQQKETLHGLLKTGAVQFKRIDQLNRFAELPSDLPEVFVPDGDLSDWNPGEAFSMDESGFVTAGRLPGEFLETNPARVWMKSNAKGMAIAFDVPKPKDPFLQTELGPGQINMDSAELFFRTKPQDIDWAGGGYQRGDIKLGFAQDSREPNRRSLRIDQGNGFVKTEDIEFAFANRKDGPGFTGEIFVPWSALPELGGVAPELLGFDLSVNMAGEPGKRLAQLTWSGTGENWMDPKAVGVLSLKAQPDGGKP